MTELIADVAIVGSGIAGTLIASKLLKHGLSVILVEAGRDNEARQQDVSTYLVSAFKGPGVPYPPERNRDWTEAGAQNARVIGRPSVLDASAKEWSDPDRNYLDQRGPQAFASSYERTVGGTGRTWLGVALRLLPSDFRMRSRFDRFVDWPLSYDDLTPWYEQAEMALGVAGCTRTQAYAGVSFSDGYEYPNPAGEISYLDKYMQHHFAETLGGRTGTITATPSARNSRYFDGRSPCIGHGSCIPICPVNARYDPASTLQNLKRYRTLDLRTCCVAHEIQIDSVGRITGIEAIEYDASSGHPNRRVRIEARRYVVAANGIESPRLLLMSRNGGRSANGIANSSGAVGRYLMDHPNIVTWGLLPEAVYPYRGPHSTSGLESFRDGEFRHNSAAFRVEIGNSGWGYPVGDPFITAVDFLIGSDHSGLNPERKRLSGEEYWQRLNYFLTRQVYLGFEIEQAPIWDNRVVLSEYFDGLGLQRPRIHYAFDDYTFAGIRHAREVCRSIFAGLGGREYTKPDGRASGTTVTDPETEERIQYFGCGHIAGTLRMGQSKSDSVVDATLRTWDHPNLYLVGSSVFPTIATANPTLTIAALSLRLADHLLAEIGG